MTKDKMVYSVIIFRSDEKHIIVLESNDYNKCYEKWKFLQNAWVDSAKETKPFVLEDPIVTAFAPSLIYEIKVIPVMAEEMANNSHNPYQQRMNQNGFMNTFPGASGMDLLSR